MNNCREVAIDFLVRVVQGEFDAVTPEDSASWYPLSMRVSAAISLLEHTTDFDLGLVDVESA